MSPLPPGKYFLRATILSMSGRFCSVCRHWSPLSRYQSSEAVGDVGYFTWL